LLAGFVSAQTPRTGGSLSKPTVSHVSDLDAGTRTRSSQSPTVVPANEKEYEPLADLLTGTPAAIVIGDKGLWGRDYAARLAAAGTRLLTPDKRRTAGNLGRERALASTRLVIESVFANLKEQMRLERHLARTPAGLAVRIAQRILALTLGMLLNRLTGRPARALAAYDGR
jgi:Transposase DDE domain